MMFDPIPWPDPIPWSEIYIDTSTLDEVEAEVRHHEGDNPACSLGPYWKNRRGPEMLERVRRTGRLPEGFVGSGWPEWQDQSAVLANDPLGLQRYFHRDDLHTRDVGDAIWQGTRLIEELERRWPGMSHCVIDIGAGSGRLAIPLLWHLSSRMTYVAVDFSPIGLLVAPQFLLQTTPAHVMRSLLGPEPHMHSLFYPPQSWKTDYGSRATCVGGDAVCVPAWLLPSFLCQPSFLDQHRVSFVSIHSLQEMEPAAIDFYFEWASSRALPGAIFYSINLHDEIILPRVPSSWRLVSERSGLPNRDGVFVERIWEIYP